MLMENNFIVMVIAKNIYFQKGDFSTKGKIVDKIIQDIVKNKVLTNAEETLNIGRELGKAEQILKEGCNHE